MLKRLIITLMILLCTGGYVFAGTKGYAAAKAKANAEKRFGDRRDVQKFIWDMHLKHGFNAWDLTLVFKKIQSEPKILAAISRPFEEVPWSEYRAQFVSEERARAGVAFWKANKEVLKRAEAQFGVPAEIIVAIIGVESQYGKNVGKYPVLQALSTLAFDYPKRKTFFRNELEEYLVLTKEEKIDPLTMMGSYAGAIGVPQFMPSSYRRYAVDFSGKGQRDLMNNMGDVIGSVANYFKSHGWKANAPIAYSAKAFGSEYQTLISKDPKPKLSINKLAQFNIRPRDKEVLQKYPNEMAAFLVLKNEKEDEPWLTLDNFYVITRYNHSVNYGMAVFQLSQRIRELYK